MVFDRNHLQTDFFLLRDGPVLVTSDRELWQAGTRWLRDVRGYRHVPWLLRSETEFHAEVSESFSWSQQFGYSPWNGNLAAFNDGVVSYPFGNNERVLITMENAERLKNWFGKRTTGVWDGFCRAARVHLLFGVKLLVLANTSSDGEAIRWTKPPGVLRLTRSTFPGAQIAREAEQTERLAATMP